MSKLAILLVGLFLIGCASTQEMLIQDMDEFELIWKGNAKVVKIDTLSRNSHSRMLKVKYRVPR